MTVEFDNEFGPIVKKLNKEADLQEADDWINKQYNESKDMYAQDPKTGEMYKLSPGELKAINKNTDQLGLVHRALKLNNILIVLMILGVFVAAVLVALVYFQTGIIGRYLALGICK